MKPPALFAFFLWLISCFLNPPTASAQSTEMFRAPQPSAPPSQPTARPTPPPSALQGESKFLGGDIPSFDPGAEIVTWDGKAWNINNNRVFEARFERYLNEPEENTEDDKAYNRIIKKLLDLLAPAKITPTSLDEAFRMLPQASAYERDALIGDALASQIHSSWQALKSRDRLAAANHALEEERKRVEWNTKMAADSSSLDSSPPSNANAAREWAKQQQLQRDARMQPYATRLLEINALLKANDLKQEVSQLQAKIEFQALLVQLFLQRRFQHVLIGTRFYRAVFNDGNGTLQVGEDAKNLFSKTTGMPPTVSTMDALASEIVRDVAEGVKAFTFLLENNEMESASKRLVETYIPGEYLPDIRTLPREKKRQALKFVQQSNQLLSAIQVRDYTLAEKLIDDMGKTAKDFDPSKPLAAIQTAKTVAAMHLAKAKNAAIIGDQATLETELKSATQLWPRNPALAEISSLIFSHADSQQRAIIDFDQLANQKNFRQIFDDRARFITATSTYPDRAAKLQKILEDVTQLETAILRAKEFDRKGDSAGAWESVEIAYRSFPDDSKLNTTRADLTTKSADFVKTIRRAEDLEKKGQLGSSLAWYLTAQEMYPPSDFAREGIDRLIPLICPQDSSR